jgi:hypothetical protein
MLAKTLWLILYSVSLSKLPRIDYQHKNDLLVIKYATFYALMKGPNWLGGK